MKDLSQNEMLEVFGGNDSEETVVIPGEVVDYSNLLKSKHDVAINSINNIR